MLKKQRAERTSVFALILAGILVAGHSSGFAGSHEQTQGESTTKQAAEVKVVFFDVGDTLVMKATDASGSAGRYVWIPGAKELIERLRSKGLRVGLISNTGNLKREEFLKMMPEDFDLAKFDPKLVLLSSEVGVAKPKVEIFQMAVTRAGVSAQEVIFVGENLIETLAAQRAGMRAARLSPPPASDVVSLADALVKAGVAEF